MWTIKYKGFYIHGYCSKDECRTDLHPGKVFKSLHAAKLAITKTGKEIISTSYRAGLLCY